MTEASAFWDSTFAAYAVVEGQTASTRSMPEADIAAMTARREYYETASLHVVDGGNLVIKVVRDVTTCVLFGWHLFGKAAEAVKDADDFGSRTQRLLERNLPDAAGRESVIGDDSRLWRHHQRQAGIQNSLAVECSKLSLPDAAYAKSILTRQRKTGFPF